MNKGTQKNQARSVSELTYAIQNRLATDFSNVTVAGEISGINQAPSGHVYMTLKDDTAQLSAIIWRSTAERIKFNVANGLKVVCRGKIDVYPTRGTYQLIVQSIQTVGQGDLQLAFRQLYERLSKHGLFDDGHKKPLPKYPRRIAVVTSPSGAAVHDFSQVVLRRWPSTEITVIPATVQGQDSAYEIASGVQFAGSQMHPAPDVIVVTRGGGSTEDLWSFNEELVVRAIFACPIPVISAVGHEVDVTLADLVADLRATTPTEAGEKVVPDRNAVLAGIQELERRLQSAITGELERRKSRLELLATSATLKSPLQRLRNASMELDGLSQRIQQSLPQRLRSARMRLITQGSKLQLHAATQLPKIRLQLQQIASTSAISRPLEKVRSYKSALESLANRLQRSIDVRLNQSRQELENISGKLGAISPLQVLSRGYSITSDLDGIPITTCQSLQVGDKIRTELADGKILSSIEEIESEN